MAVHNRKDYPKLLLPTEVVGLIKNTISRLCEILLIILGGFLAVCYWSYSPLDPSMNTAIEVASGTSMSSTHNLLGIPGALVADISIQIFGAASFLLGAIFMIWGVRSVFGYPLKRPLLKAVGLFLCLVFGAMLLTPFSPLPSWTNFSSLGGAIGQLTYDLKQHFSFSKNGSKSYLSQFFFVLIFAPGIMILFLGTLFYSLDISWRRFWTLIQTVASQIGQLLETGKGPSKSYPSEEHGSVIDPKFGHSLKADDEEDTSQFGFGSGFETTEQADDRLDGSGFHFDQEEDEHGIPLPSPSALLHPESARVPTTMRFNESSISGEDYKLPTIDLLDPPVKKATKVMTPEMMESSARQLEQVLKEFGVRGEIVHVRPGPVVTLYELKPAPGIKTSRVIGLADDIARSMSALSTRIAVIPGRNVIGIELPNTIRETVYLRDLLLSSEYAQTTASLPLILGKEIGGAPIIVDLVRMPHLLVAGTTGSGKSVAINTMILSLLYRLTPDQCRFIMIDPKMLELSVYDDIPHLLTPVVTDPKKAVVALKWAAREMENRYRAMSKLGVRNIDGYNVRIREARSSGELLMRRVQTGFDPDSGKPIFENQSLDLDLLPHIVIIVDEMADLMLVAGKEIEATIQRLAQMARAAGIHLIMATQRPSVDVITGTIKANFPTRISFQVTSKIDSRTILGDQGAEQLLGQGDMLYMAGGGRVIRVHGPLVKDNEVERASQYIKMQGEPSYDESVTEDDELDFEGSEGDVKGGDALYSQAVEVVLREGKASTSFVQRHLQIGYNRAARIIEDMEKQGIISAANHAGKREVLGR